MSNEIDAERERCARIADGLAGKWEASATNCRQKGMTSFFGLWPYVSPQADRDAKAIEAAAHGLRTVARLIRGGAQPREHIAPT